MMLSATSEMGWRFFVYVVNKTLMRLGNTAHSPKNTPRAPTIAAPSLTKT